MTAFTQLQELEDDFFEAPLTKNVALFVQPTDDDVVVTKPRDVRLGFLVAAGAALVFYGGLYLCYFAR